jgi:hypothetical protein
MIAVLLGLLAAGLGVAAGGPWWILLAAAPFLVPGRIGPAVGALAIVALLPWGAGPLWKDLLLFAAGVLAGWGVLHRIGHTVPWVAVPWWLAGFLLLELAWSVAGPRSYWTDSDVAIRLRIAVLAAAACVGLALHYFPRYRYEGPGPAPGGAGPPGIAGPAPGEGGGGTAGGRDETR